MKKSFSSWNLERRPEIFQFLSTSTSALPNVGCGSSQSQILLFFGYCKPNCIQYSWGTWLGWVAPGFPEIFYISFAKKICTIKNIHNYTKYLAHVCVPRDVGVGEHDLKLFSKTHRDAKSCRSCRYICAIFFQLVLIFGSFLGHFGNFGSFLGH